MLAGSIETASGNIPLAWSVVFIVLSAFFFGIVIYHNWILPRPAVDANRHNTDAKSIIDGISSMILASTLGIGVLFSAVAVFIYQGAISLLGVYIEPYLTEVVISQMSFVGSILIFAIGLRMLNIAKIKVGNLLPAVFMPILFDLVTRLVQRIAG